MEGQNVYAYEVDGLGNQLVSEGGSGAQEGMRQSSRPRQRPSTPARTAPAAHHLHASLPAFAGVPRCTPLGVSPCPMLKSSPRPAPPAQVDFDDANVPSLLSIPLLGYRHFDAAIYEATRARLLSPKNPWYFESEKLRGVGSPHTPPVRASGWLACSALRRAPNSPQALACCMAREGIPLPRQINRRCWRAPAQACAYLLLLAAQAAHPPKAAKRPTHLHAFVPPQGYVWPLGLSVQGLTSHDPKERADLLRTLLKLQCGNGLMHESGGWVGWL